MTELREWVPRWWRGEAGAAGALASFVLAPAEAAYRTAIAARNSAFERGWKRSARAAVPVVSVGNIAVGGAGKTPVAAWVVRRLLDAGRSPAVVLRGYGLDEVRVHQVLNPAARVIVAASRVEGAARAVEEGCDVCVLDDGFQHRALRRDLDIVLVSAEGWRARRRLLPRGPWREPAAALGRADLIVVTRKSASPEESQAVEESLRRLVPDVPVAGAHLAPGFLVQLGGGGDLPLTALRGERVLAVASLADPRPFAAQLRALGAEVRLLAFPDHHHFDRVDVERIRSAADGDRVVMTLKDAVKLEILMEPGSAWVMRQEMRMERGGDVVERALAKAVSR